MLRTLTELFYSSIQLIKFTLLYAKHIKINIINLILFHKRQMQ